jgi:hypothetical protein
MKIDYKDWKVKVEQNLLIVEKLGEMREYDLPEWKTAEHNMEYIYITLPDDSLIQFKMEIDDFWVGDKFDSEGEYIDTLACHVFGEEID